MYLLVIFLPLFSSIFAVFFGRYIGKQGVCILTTASLFISSILSCIIFYETLISHSITTVTLFTWIKVGTFFVDFTFLFDSLTGVMLVIVTIISSLVHFYSIGYMEGDPHVIRFMSYLSLFTFFMLVLISANNFLLMFFGWEGVGLASYLLINFWYTRATANKAAMKAIIVNRIGDFGLSVAIVMIFFVFQSLDYAVVFNLVPLFYNEYFIFFGYSCNKITLITIFLFLGAIGKSAQIGLHTWLPDAMEGPTPVSALIHAATMVTAGVFILLRSSPILEFSNFTLLVITIIGSLTAFMAATIGMVQNDMKKVIAYSTCSQLGYMIFACGLSNYSVSLFHLMNHAFFKALLFLTAGSIIHAMADEQDMRKYGGLLKILPVSYIMMLVGSLALMGFPFMTGFYSKDIILELSYGTYYFSGMFAYYLGILSAFFTAFYSLRLIYMSFLKTPNAHRIMLSNVEEGTFFMLFPLIVLALGSLFVGFVAKDLFLGLGVDSWNISLFQLPNNINFLEAELLSINIKLIPFFFTIFGIFFAIFIYGFFEQQFVTLNFYRHVYFIFSFFLKKWYFDIIYNNYVVKNIYMFGYWISFKSIDRGLIEYFGPLGIIVFLKNFSFKISKMQTGLIYHYIFIMILFTIIYILTFLLPAYVTCPIYILLCVNYLHERLMYETLKFPQV